MLISLIQLFIFIILTFLLLTFPALAKNRKEKAGFLNNLSISKEDNFNFQKLKNNLTYFMRLFEYLFRNNFGVHFFWTTGFISWILGCCLWVLKTEIISLIFISISIILCLIALFDSSKISLNDVYNLKINELNASIYSIIISISVLTMIALNSIGIELTTNILLILILYDFKVYRRKKLSLKSSQYEG